VSNVDFLRRRLEVVQQLVLVQGRPPFLGPPKNDAGVRTIPLPQVAIDARAEHLAKYPAGEDQLVFANEHGNPISRTRFSDPWRRAVRAAGVPHGTGFHALRHYASLLIRRGESAGTPNRGPRLTLGRSLGWAAAGHSRSSRAASFAI